MPGSSNTSVNNSSFIPKRGPTRRRKPKSKNQIFIFSIITYSLLFAALLAAAATFFYKNYLTSELQTEVATLNTAIDTFKNDDLDRVQAFDVTLKRASERIGAAASVVSVLDAVDVATVEPVQLDGLLIERSGDEQFLVAGTVLTSSFDAAIFQRKIMKANRQLFNNVLIEDISVAEIFDEQRASQVAVSNENEELELKEVTFEITTSVPLSEAAYDPQKVRKFESDNVAVPRSASSSVSNSQETTI